ncbi:MAG TPA: SDR family oxidoreductase [Sporichthya sp.]|nr:SDR family oxidoreductase [Sporichthya sp.]
MDLQLSGRRALVTGGTKGIGRAVVDALAAEGVAVAFCARTEAEVKQAETSLVESGAHAVGTALDVADADALRAWVEASAAELGGIDIVVANVSAMAMQADEAGWHASFEVDLMHTVRTVEAAMPYLEASDAASVIAISSVSGREVDFVPFPYGALKASVVHYTAGLAQTLAAKGIRANAVSPGNTYFPGGIWPQIEEHMPDLFGQAMGLNPSGRMGTAEEVAYAVVMLASPRASRISGTNLVVDGALTRGVQL